MLKNRNIETNNKETCQSKETFFQKKLYLQIICKKKKIRTHSYFNNKNNANSLKNFVYSKLINKLEKVIPYNND